MVRKIMVFGTVLFVLWSPLLLSSPSLAESEITDSVAAKLNEKFVYAALLRQGYEIDPLVPWKPVPARASRSSSLICLQAAELACQDSLLCNPDYVLRRVWETLPDKSIVFPSEMYFYWQIDLHSVHVSGNIRFTDVAESVVHIGYFDVDPHVRGFAHKSFRDDGTSIVQHIDFDASTSIATITIDDLTRKFYLFDATRLTIDWDLLIEEPEEVICTVLDESGFVLWLIFNAELDQFYYVRPSALPFPFAVNRYTLPDCSTGLTGDEIVACVASRFVFYSDKSLGRDILVAVHRSEIAANIYFDGPFDQVPPRLDIRDRLMRAYPYLDLQGGIDQHGNFLELESTRVAISPYIAYTSLLEIYRSFCDLLRSDLDGPLKWSLLVRESKQDFHLRFQDRNMNRENALTRSIAWPANHWYQTSVKWPESHDSLSSLQAPANRALPNED